MNKPKDDPKKKLDDVISRFLGNDADEEESDQDDAEYDDIEVDAEKD